MDFSELKALKESCDVTKKTHYITTQKHFAYKNTEKDIDLPLNV